MADDPAAARQGPPRRPPRHPPPAVPPTSPQELGAAALSKRPTSCMLILPKPLKGAAEVDEEFGELYSEVEKKIKASAPVF
jgi:H/ACA ribonucleoprotein complex subunit 2